MTALHSLGLFRGLTIRRCVRGPTFALVLGVMVVWLAIYGTLVLTIMPMVPPAHGLAIEPGQVAHLNASPLVEWWLPVSRLQFDAYQLALDSDDEMALTKITAIIEWITATDRQAVLVLVVDEDAVQVELLEGANAGRQGWLHRKQLFP